MRRAVWTTTGSYVAALLFLSGCTTYESLIPAVGIGELRFEPLEDSEFRILDDVVGTATGGRILFWSYGPTSIFDSRSGALEPRTSSNPADLYGRIGRDPEIAAAMFDAIEGSPNADSLLAPKVWKSKFQAFLWSSYEVEVVGKGIEITKDKNAR